MPDYLIAVRQDDLAFESGARVERTVHLYNQLFRDLNIQLECELWAADRMVNRQTASVDLMAGSQKVLQINLPIPAVQQRTDSSAGALP